MITFLIVGACAIGASRGYIALRNRQDANKAAAK